MLASQCLCTNLRRAARGVSRHYDGALDGFGINVAQYSLLCNLQRLDQPSISSLADAMGLDRSTLGRNLRVLEGEGLVRLVEGDDLRNRLVLSDRSRCRTTGRRIASVGSGAAEID